MVYALSPVPRGGKAAAPDKPVVIVCPTEEAAADKLLGIWKRAGAAAVNSRGEFFVALSGGKTPQDFYRRLAGADLPFWPKTRVFQVDERLVPIRHPDRNLAMIKRTLLNRVSIPPGHIHPLPVTRMPDLSAAIYEKELRRAFNLKEGRWPRFDLVLLGCGRDGHTASLFPGDPALEVRDRLAVGVNGRAVKHPRVTLTLPVINQARTVAFLIAGKEKAGIVKRILTASSPLPARQVSPKRGRLYFVLAGV